MPNRKERKRPARPNATGRNNKTARFAMLPHRVLESAAFASLDLVGRALLQELVMLYNGDNNGSIYLSASDATARLGLADKRPALRAFDDLLDRRLIHLTKDAYFRVRASETSRARCWRISWLSWPECPTHNRRVPLWDFEQYAPPSGAASRRADKRLRALSKYKRESASGRLPGVNFTPMEANLPKEPINAGEDFTPPRIGIGGIAPFAIGVDSTPYLDDTRRLFGLGWWRPEREAQITGQILLLSIAAQNRPPLAKAA